MNQIFKTCLALLAFVLPLNFVLAQQILKPVKVEIRKTANGYELLRSGKSYFIKGAGGTYNMEKLKASGGNSVRTWNSNNGDEVLNRADKLGLTVTMGLNVARERHGFNYDDSVAVKKQLERLRTEVRKYKNHPALLAWGIGNELNLDYKNPKVWDAVNEIAKMIHQEDGNHPATTMLAGVNKGVINFIKTKCPELDLLSVQVYGELAKVPEMLTAAGWSAAYMVTEWGPTGHWECPKTPWGAPIEESSSEKAAVYRSRYEASILKDENCLGSYVFLWGQKQERTPTWYGLFTEAGEDSEVVDVMEYEWSGKWPANKAPHLNAIHLDGKKALDFIYLSPTKTYPVFLSVSDPDGDQLETRWEILPEATDLGQGGDKETRPQAIKGLIKTSPDKVDLTAPEKPGAYRLFVYVADGKNNVATANIPFYVR
ncbi:hypothetical protein DU508_11360 [Pedobacter chinensis]|uniref:Glycoside hydrolase family 2 catalytic domain-containing protein n=1 Tax=Pedobacter chinensis TaxID=2282421 RepID=A0A369PU71_9SPHI|nr:glycoside hydrolase family 2 TIM barrel-domain containing protein [Pedobacter chinensis]RDC56201.1 hypothetical protein DU508_11360 [Pedobacter chinensis]